MEQDPEFLQKKVRELFLNNAHELTLIMKPKVTFFVNVKYSSANKIMQIPFKILLLMKMSQTNLNMSFCREVPSLKLFFDQLYSTFSPCKKTFVIKTYFCNKNLKIFIKFLILTNKSFYICL